MSSLAELRRASRNPIHRWGIRPLPVRAEDHVGRGRLLPIPGGKVFVASVGAGPPVVALPGFAGSSRTWHAIVRRLEDSFTFHLVDFLGYGLSDKPPDADHSPVGQARQLEAVMDALGIRRSFLLSNSASAPPAIHAVFRQPRRFLANIMIAPFVAPAPLADLGARLAAWPIAKHVMSGLFGFRPFMFFADGLGCHDASWVNGEVVDEQYLPFGTEGYWNSLAGAAKHLRPRALTGLVQMIATPTLVIWGATDRAGDLRKTTRLLSAIPDVRFEVIPNCGHVLQEERPDDAAAIVREFLKSVKVAAPDAAPAGSADVGASAR